MSEKLSELELAEKLMDARNAGVREASEYRLKELSNCISQSGASWGVADWDDVRDFINFAGKAFAESQRAARAEARPAPVVGREGEPSEDFIRLVAEAMGARTGYSISLTRLVDGVETYTLSMDGYEPQDFDDRDEAAEVLHQRLNRDRAKRLIALLSPATSPGEGSSSAESAARIASDHAASETLRKSEEG